MTSYFADTHPGHKRTHNEDCYSGNPELGLWLVADGVGGHADGEVAAAIVRETLKSDLTHGKSLIDAIHHSHSEILTEIASREESNMGSTVVALKLEGQNYEIAWVGDSRAYLFDGGLRQITRDHNPVSEMLARGALTPEQAAVHPERNVLSQSLGVSDTISVAPGRIRGELEPGQQLLLCSDGLTDELNDQRIAEILSSESSPQAQVESLIQGALEAGGRDNVTVVVVGDKNSAANPAQKGPTTLPNETAVAAPSSRRGAHDSKVLMLLGLMGLLAVIWVALRIF
jgi:PPM family protein phosphatase